MQEMEATGEWSDDEEAALAMDGRQVERMRKMYVE